jgi:hypothetical protein
MELGTANEKIQDLPSVALQQELQERQRSSYSAKGDQTRAKEEHDKGSDNIFNGARAAPQTLRAWIKQPSCG